MSLLYMADCPTVLLFYSRTHKTKAVLLRYVAERVEPWYLYVPARKVLPARPPAFPCPFLILYCRKMRVATEREKLYFNPILDHFTQRLMYSPNTEKVRTLLIKPFNSSLPVQAKRVFLFFGHRFSQMNTDLEINDKR